VVTSDEQFGPFLASLIADRLGLPHTPLDAIVTIQHKYYAREAPPGDRQRLRARRPSVSMARASSRRCSSSVAAASRRSGAAPEGSATPRAARAAGTQSRRARDAVSE